MAVRKHLPVLAAVIAAAAACSSPPAPPAALTAQQLAQKITQCSGVTADTPSSIETAEASCTLADGSPVTIGTFATSGAEQQWIQAGGSPSSPDPLYVGCCVQGDGWAATVGFAADGSSLESGYRIVMSALGGRQVTG